MGRRAERGRWEWGVSAGGVEAGAADGDAHCDGYDAAHRGANCHQYASGDGDEYATASGGVLDVRGGHL
jgi:hypothetical protein